MERLSKKLQELMLKIYVVFLEIGKESDVPLCLKRNVRRFYLIGILVLFVGLLLLVVEHSFATNWVGLVVGPVFIICGLYQTRQYKLKRYDVIYGKCLDIHVKKVNPNKITGEKYKYIIETDDGRMLVLHMNIGNMRIQKDKGVVVYVKQNSIMPEQTDIHGCLGFDVSL